MTQSSTVTRRLPPSLASRSACCCFVSRAAPIGSRPGVARSPDSDHGAAPSARMFKSSAALIPYRAGLASRRAGSSATKPTASRTQRPGNAPRDGTGGDRRLTSGATDPSLGNSAIRRGPPWLRRAWQWLHILGDREHGPPRLRMCAAVSRASRVPAPMLGGSVDQGPGRFSVPILSRSRTPEKAPRAPPEPGRSRGVAAAASTAWPAGPNPRRRDRRRLAAAPTPGRFGGDATPNVAHLGYAATALPGGWRTARSIATVADMGRPILR
jgi:hypothetical protein